MLKTASEVKKKGVEMNDAISGNEAILTWDDHRIGTEKLA